MPLRWRHLGRKLASREPSRATRGAQRPQQSTKVAPECVREGPEWLPTTHTRDPGRARHTFKQSLGTIMTGYRFSYVASRKIYAGARPRDDPILAPRWPQQGPQKPQEPPNEPKTRPRRPQRRFKTPPDPPARRPRTLFRRFWHDFGKTFGFSLTSTCVWQIFRQPSFAAN